MMKVICCVIAFSVVLCSCHDEAIVPFVPNGCLIDQNFKDLTNVPCTIHAQSCVPTEVDGEFYFIEAARKFLPQSCLPLGSKIFYENAKGDHIGFKITLKDHTLVRSSYLSNPPCVNMPDYCFKSELFKLEMESDNDLYHLAIRLEVFVRGSPINWIQRDGMNIRDLNLPDQGTVFYLSLYNLPPPDNQFFPTYEILGTTFNEVYSIQPPTHESSAITIFYNSDYGMVAFIDGNGETWRIVI
jgi:hypothetical protein